jgi:hypothetical protein
MIALDMIYVLAKRSLRRSDKGVTKAVSAGASQSERIVGDYLREEQLNSIASIYWDNNEKYRMKLDGVGSLSLDDLALLVQDCETDSMMLVRMHGMLVRRHV